MGKGQLRVRLERITLTKPFTESFERYLLRKQADGAVMLQFTNEQGAELLVYFGTVSEIEGDMETSLGTVQVAPWRLYVFNAIDTVAQAGDQFTSLRLVDDYVNYLRIGDPVEMVDLGTGTILGTAEVVTMHQFRLGSATPEIIQACCQGRARDVQDMQALLSYQYDRPVGYDEVVTAVVLYATSDVNLDTSDLYEEHQPIPQRSAPAQSLAARLVGKIRGRS